MRTPAAIRLYALRYSQRTGNKYNGTVTVACQSCNSKKGAGPVLKPVQPLLLTIAPAKKPKGKP